MFKQEKHWNPFITLNRFEVKEVDILFLLILRMDLHNHINTSSSGEHFLYFMMFR